MKAWHTATNYVLILFQIIYTLTYLLVWYMAIDIRYTPKYNSISTTLILVTIIAAIMSFTTLIVYTMYVSIYVVFWYMYWYYKTGPATKTNIAFATLSLMTAIICFITSWMVLFSYIQIIKRMYKEAVLEKVYNNNGLFLRLSEKNKAQWKKIITWKRIKRII